MSVSEDCLETELKPRTVFNLLFGWDAYDVLGDIVRTMLGIRREGMNRQVDLDLDAESKALRWVATVGVEKR